MTDTTKLRVMFAGRAGERDASGELTDVALAIDALVNSGCDCGEDEPGTCLGCRCESAMVALTGELDALRAEVARLKENLLDAAGTLSATVVERDRLRRRDDEAAGLLTQAAALEERGFDDLGERINIFLDGRAKS